MSVPTSDEREAWVRQARYLGADAAMTAATWLEMSEADATSILEDIDPEVLERYEPPNLSGEWADDPTPDSLAFDITGLSFDFDRVLLVDELADAWEAGRDAVWSDALQAHALRLLGRIDAALYAEAQLERRMDAMRGATR